MSSAIVRLSNCQGTLVVSASPAGSVNELTHGGGLLQVISADE